jgi:hypothetical protein
MAEQHRDVKDPATPAPSGAAGGSVEGSTGPHTEIGHPSRRGWWAASIAAVVVITVVAVVVIVAGNDNGTTTSSSQAGEVTTSDGQNVLALVGQTSALAALEGQSVEATSVPVQGFVPGAGFWVGTENDRLFIWQPDSPSFGTGDQVDLTGVITALPSDFKAAFGIEVPETARVLRHEGVYVVPQTVTPSP